MGLGKVLGKVGNVMRLIRLDNRRSTRDLPRTVSHLPLSGCLLVGSFGAMHMLVNVHFFHLTTFQPFS